MKRTPCILTVALLCLTGSVDPGRAAQPTPADTSKALRALRVPFERNTGQLPPQVAFSARTLAGGFFVTTRGELVLAGPRSGVAPDSRLVLRESLAGGHVREIAGVDPSQTRISSFIGDDPARWQRQVPTYGAVSLGEVYDRIELSLAARGDTVEKVFRVLPGGDPAAIRVTVAGAGGLSVDGEGRLVPGAAGGKVAFTKPVAYQVRDGVRQPVSAAYRLVAGGYSFEVGDYDRERVLVIDPLIQSTFLGGTGDRDRVYSVGVHPVSGDIYVAGTTDSLDFPVAGTAQFPSHGGGLEDAYIAVLDRELTSIVQATYFGGRGDEAAGTGEGGNALAFNPSNGDVYITGFTTSGDLPGTFEAAQSSKSGGLDGYIAWFSQDLATLHRTTYLGGSDYDLACGIAFRARRYGAYHYLYVVGRTLSTNLPGISGWSFQTTKKEGWDAFVGFVRSDLRSFKTTYLGGSGDDWGYGVAVRPEPLDLTYEVYVTGRTQSSNLPATSGAAQPRRRGYVDGFVSLLSVSLERVKRTTYFGGSGGDEPVAIALGSLGLGGPVYIGGTTYSTNLPFAAGGARTRHGGGVRDGFVAMFTATLTPPAYATYLGGSNHDAVYSVAVSPLSGDVYVSGDTSSANFPGARSGAQTALSGQNDGFVSRLSLSLSQLRRSTYLGGGSQEWAMGVAVHPESGDVHAGGVTRSTDFPGAVEGAQDTNHGGQDGFVARFDPGLGGSTLRVLDPNGGEKVPAGSTFDIRWLALAGMETFTLQYKWEGMDAWRTIVSRTTGDSYSWPVPTPTKNRVKCAVKVIAHNAAGRVVATDLSDAFFTVEVVTLTAPNGGETFTPGDVATVGWRTRGTVRPVARVRLLYALTGEAPWVEIELLDGNPGTYDWTIPPVQKDSIACKLRVDLLDGAGVVVGTDTSDGSFTMNGSVKLDSPDGGQVLTPGETTPIAWTTHATAGEIAQVRLSYSLTGRAPWRLISMLDGNPGNYDWTVPGVVSDTRTVRVQVELLDSLTRVAASDASDGNLMIWGSVQLVTPVGGEILTGGGFHTIEWTTSATSAPVATSWLDLTKDGGVTWEPIMHMAGNYGVWDWHVPAVRERKDRCLVRVRLKSASGAIVAEDKSTIFFRIEPAP